VNVLYSSHNKRAVVLYVTMDGILSHLGFSQVARLLEGLGDLGFRYSLASLERQADLARHERVAAVEARLRAHGVTWFKGAYQEGGTQGSVLANLLQLRRVAAQAWREASPAIVHARGYHAMAVSLSGLGRGARLIFDARGYWIDERVEEGRWFTTPATVGVARALERQLYRRSAAVVTLTKLQAAEMVGLVRPGVPVVVVPTCADYEEFQPRARGARPPPSIAEVHTAPLVVGIVGSINRSYRTPETAALAARVLERRPSARVLVLSSQHDAWRTLLRGAGVPSDSILAMTVDHEEMPRYLPWLSWALLLLDPNSRAKRASMPTKLGEFFASGVRVCGHGCNEEVDEWIRKAGGGHVLPTLSRQSLEDAADIIVGSEAPGPNWHARATTMEHFSLQSGTNRYADLLGVLG
jgi:hypothetical protein